uniref:Uncharacterized protein n=1 Tax=Timema bartmani TaxID=61472 RepID=A0A7R9HZX2_9NEOP|nr:unnamed protein product [Timema bartmani]
MRIRHYPGRAVLDGDLHPDSDSSSKVMELLYEASWRECLQESNKGPHDDRSRRKQVDITQQEVLPAGDSRGDLWEHRQGVGWTKKYQPNETYTNKMKTFSRMDEYSFTPTRNIVTENNAYNDTEVERYVESSPRHRTNVLTRVKSSNSFKNRNDSGPSVKTPIENNLQSPQKSNNRDRYNPKSPVTNGKLHVRSPKVLTRSSYGIEDFENSEEYSDHSNSSKPTSNGDPPKDDFEDDYYVNPTSIKPIILQKETKPRQRIEPDTIVSLNPLPNNRRKHEPINRDESSSSSALDSLINGSRNSSRNTALESPNSKTLPRSHRHENEYNEYYSSKTLRGSDKNKLYDFPSAPQRNKELEQEDLLLNNDECYQNLPYSRTLFQLSNSYQNDLQKVPNTYPNKTVHQYNDRPRQTAPETSDNDRVYYDYPNPSLIPIKNVGLNQPCQDERYSEEKLYPTSVAARTSPRYPDDGSLQDIEYKASGKESTNEEGYSYYSVPCSEVYWPREADGSELYGYAKCVGTRTPWEDPDSCVRVEGDSSSVEDLVDSSEEFAIPRPKLIVPVHTYGIRKRRTGNMLHVVRGGSVEESADVGPAPVSDKKHHTSCPDCPISNTARAVSSALRIDNMVLTGCRNSGAAQLLAGEPTQYRVQLSSIGGLRFYFRGDGFRLLLEVSVTSGLAYLRQNTWTIRKPFENRNYLIISEELSR